MFNKIPAIFWFSGALAIGWGIGEFVKRMFEV